MPRTTSQRRHKSFRLFSAFGLALSSLLACGQYSEQDFSTEISAIKAAPKPPQGFPAEVWTQLLTMSPLPEVPADLTNAVADECDAADLGQRFFFDPRFSGALVVESDLGLAGEVGKVSCASCHAGDMMDDRRSSVRTVSIGANFHTRNAPGIVNSSFYTWTNWGGRFSAQWELPLPVTESGVIMNGSRLQTAHVIFEFHRKRYERIFGTLSLDLADTTRFPLTGKPKATAEAANGAWELMSSDDRALVNEIFVNYGKALGAYFRRLTSGDSPFDRFMAGKKNALGDAAQRGAQLFVGKARCSGCHNGPTFTDNRFHNLGVPQTGDHVPASDDGQFKDVPPLLTSAFNSAGVYSDAPEVGAARLAGLTNPMPESTRGMFRTPGLRGVALSEPYMHSGQLATLEEVIDFYDAGGGTAVSGTKSPFLIPLGLSSDEKADLLAFLYSLTGKQVSAKYRTSPRP